MKSPTLILFSRSPYATNAKSRLKASLDEQFVNELHTAMVLDSIDAIGGMNEFRRVTYSWDSDEGELKGLESIATGVHKVQKGDTFLQKLVNALQDEIASHPDGTIVIGSDCPLLSPAILDEAVKEVRAGKLVLGPSTEGGFYLLGLPPGENAQNLFAAFENPLEITGVRHLYNHLPLSLLPILTDIDLPEDLISVAALLPLLSEAEDGWKPIRTLELLNSLVVEKGDGSRGKHLAIKSSPPKQ